MRAVVAALLVCAAPAAAVDGPLPGGELYAFPTLLDDAETPIATSTLAQWFEDGRLHVRITHRFADGRQAVERARFTQGKELLRVRYPLAEVRDPAVVIETLGTPRPPPRGARDAARATARSR